MTKEEKIDFVNSLSPKAKAKLNYSTEIWLRDNQIIPEGDWRYCLLLCGRGFGKSFTIAADLKKQVEAGEREIALICPTYPDMSRVMIPMIQKMYAPKDRPRYIENRSVLIYPNGGPTIDLYTSDGEIRGGNYSRVYCDELVNWCQGSAEKVQQIFSVLNFTCRKGGAKFVIATTGKPWPIFKKWEEMWKAKSRRIVIVRGSMNDNEFLSDQAKADLEEEYGGDRFGRQEIDGEITWDTEGALFKAHWFEESRSKEAVSKLLPEMKRIVVAIDPAVSNNANSDETGLIVAGIDDNNHMYVLGDYSGRYDSAQWAKKAVELYHLHQADCIVAEINNGGTLVADNLRANHTLVPIRTVHATRGKMTRAHPVATLAERGELHIVGTMKTLEDQCCAYTGNPRQNSPDRMDALCWAAYELIIKQRTTRRNLRFLPRM